MTATVLGWTPISIMPVLSRGQDWEVTIQLPTGSTWPASSTVTAYVYAPNTDTTQPIADWTAQYTWDGTINTGNTEVSFKGVYSECDEVLPGALMRIRVVYPNTPANDNFTWCGGFVERDD
jgi:hypothetical protein